MAPIPPPSPQRVPVGAAGLGPRIASMFQSSSPTGGMTLDALMLRQRELARQQQALGDPGAQTSTIAGGLGHMLDRFTTSFQEGQARSQEAAGRQQLAQLLGGIDPNTGVSQDQLGQIAALDPELGMKLYEQAIAQRSAAAAEATRVAERTQDRDWKVADDAAARAAEQSKLDDQQKHAIELQEDQQTATAQESRLGREDAERVRLANEAEKERLRLIDAAKPTTDAGKSIADYEANQYGPKESPEAQRLRDEALKKATSTTKPMTASDYAELSKQQSAYINSGSSIQKLQRAKDLIDQGIDYGYLTSLRTGASTAGWGGDPELAKRTKEFNSIMERGAITDMAQTLAGATTNEEMARFINNMNDQTLDPQVRRTMIEDLIVKSQAFNTSQKDLITRMGGEEAVPKT